MTLSTGMHFAMQGVANTEGRALVNRPIVIYADALENLGDLALLHQGVVAARDAGRSVYVWQWTLPDGKIAKQIEGFGCAIIAGKSLFSAGGIAFRSDAVIGGGQIVRDNVTPASLIFMSLTLLCTKLGGGRVSSWGLGVSPIKRPLLRVLWSIILSLSDKIRVRDSLSEHNVRRMTKKNAIFQTADMVFLPTRLHRDLNAPSSRVRSIVIAPCIEPSEGRSIDGPGFAQLLTHIMASLPGAGLVLACHDPRPAIDGGAADLLISKYNLPLGSKHDDGLLASLCDVYSNAAVVITNRLHACIFALISGTPLIIVEDGSAKMRALAQMFSAATIDLSEVLDNASVDATVRSALDYDRVAAREVLADAARAATGNLEALRD